MEISVGELIEQLSMHDMNLMVDFQGLEFLRLKQRSPTLVQVEFVQIVGFDKKLKTWSAYTPQ